MLLFSVLSPKMHNQVTHLQLHQQIPKEHFTAKSIATETCSLKVGSPYRVPPAMTWGHWAWLLGGTNYRYWGSWVGMRDDLHWAPSAGHSRSLAPPHPHTWPAVHPRVGSYLAVGVCVCVRCEGCVYVCVWDVRDVCVWGLCTARSNGLFQAQLGDYSQVMSHHYTNSV